MTIKECKDNISRVVVYIPTLESGIIMNANDGYAFVRFTGDIHSKARRSGDLCI